MEDIGKRIKRRRKELGMSAEEVAAKMGVSPATVYRYESQYILNMGTDKLEGIARVLETTPAYLMGWEEKENSPGKFELTEGEKMLLALFRMVPEEKQQLVLEMIKAALKMQK